MLQLREAGALEGGIVIVVEVVDADDFHAALEQALGDMHADKTCTAGDQDLQGQYSLDIRHRCAGFGGG
jgi:hypothetical protein